MATAHRYWLFLGVFFLLAASAWAQTSSLPPDEPRMTPLQGAPVNTSISGAGLLPEGHAITAYNFSYRDRAESVQGQDNQKNPHPDNVLWLHLLKLRYGLTDRLEIASVIPYTMLHRETGPDLDSFGDIAVGASYGFLQQRLGDPLSLALSAGVNLPTGQYGQKHLPGGGAWGGRVALSASKILGLHKFDADVIATLPFHEGNQGVKKGASGMLTYKYAYALSSRFDLGLEGTVERTWAGQRNKVNLQNETLEWYTGPALTMAIPEISSWVGVGVYFPVYREYSMNTAVDSVRLDFKFGIFW